MKFKKMQDFLKENPEYNTKDCISGIWITFENNKRKKFLKWYENGNLWIYAEFLKGMRDGLYKEYYPDGILWERSEWKKGILNGTIKKNCSDGLLREELNYQDGIIIF